MEVHHHPHVEKKSFKQYLLEGLMIFIAVSMGFIAENIREYIVDAEREHQYVEAFTRDLKADTASIEGAIRSNVFREKILDSLLVVSNADLTINANAKQLVHFFMKGAFRPAHRPATSAIAQLKNTGSFRLFHKKAVVDSILRYDDQNIRIVEHNDFYAGDLNLLWESFYPICDVKIFRDSSFAVYTANTRELTDKPVPPLHLSQEKMSVFTGHVTRQVLINQVNRSYLQSQHLRAKRLLEFLENEYHLSKTE